MLVVKAQYVDVVETEGARVYTFRASTASVDRQNEIVDQTPAGSWILIVPIRWCWTVTSMTRLRT